MTNKEKGKSIGWCATTSSTRKNDMTMLIHARNENKVIVASDSWNKFPGEPNLEKHYIQKICFNEKCPIIIGQSGENSMLLGNQIIYIKDIMQNSCNMYNGYNIQNSIDNLIRNTYDYLDRLKLGDWTERLIQYFIVYFDFKSKTIQSINFEFIKNEYNIRYEIRNNLNINFCSFGTYQNICNIKHNLVQLNTFDNKELENEILSELKSYIDLNKKNCLSIDDISVEGPIQWAEITKEGLLTYKKIDI